MSDLDEIVDNLDDARRARARLRTIREVFLLGFVATILFSCGFQGTGRWLEPVPAIVMMERTP